MYRTKLETSAASSRPKDLLYIHDTLELFGGSLAELNTMWTNGVSPRLSDRAVHRLGRTIDRVTDTVSDEARSAVQAATGRTLSPELLTDVCREGLGRVFV